jgi:signal peptidase
MNKRVILLQNIINVFAWVFLGLFALGLILTVAANFNVLGGYRQLIVQSGSMEPTIMTGDIIVIGRSNIYQKNDVVTFRDSEKSITTHRIYEVDTVGGEKQFVTKGDANRVQDNNVVSEKEVMGKVILTVPKLGYFIFFLRSRMGIAIFLILPACLIVVDEIINIFKQLKTKKKVSEN